MSLYSTTLQVRATPAELREALPSLPLDDLMLGSNERWISVLYEEEEHPVFDGLTALVYYGEDEGLWIKFFLRDEHIGELSSVWGEPWDVPEAEPRGASVSPDLLDQLRQRGAMEPEECSALISAQRSRGDSEEDLRSFGDEMVRLLRFPVAWQ